MSWSHEKYNITNLDIYKVVDLFFSVAIDLSVNNKSQICF